MLQYEHRCTVIISRPRTSHFFSTTSCCSQTGRDSWGQMCQVVKYKVGLRSLTTALSSSLTLTLTICYINNI